MKNRLNPIYVDEYTKGLTIWQIAGWHNDTYKNVYEGITGHRFESRLLPVEEKEMIKALYENHVSTVKIGQLYGVWNKSIAAVLDEYGIERNQNEMVRRYNVDQHYFDVIDTPNKAYVLGFLSADGCNFPSKCTISMSLEECDREVLEAIREDMKNEHPLEYIDYSNKHDFGYTYKNQYRMLIFSKHMCNQLTDKGVVPNKSLQLKFSSKVKPEFYSHYVRGVFDGDGSIGVKSLESYTGSISISLTSTFDFCNSLALILDGLGVDYIIGEASNHNGITAALYISKAKSKKVFLDWIYKDAELFLERKHDIYIKHYGIAV